MGCTSRIALAGSVTLIAITALITGVHSVKAQSSPVKTTKIAATSNIRRFADGKPDLTGYWSNSTVTPLERPDALADKEFISDNSAAILEKNGNRSDATRGGAAGGRRGGAGGSANVGDYNALWYEQDKKVLANKRTSILTDPANGKIPPLTTEAGKWLEEQRRYFDAHPADGPESFDNITRCITWISSGPPMLPTFYNNNYQLLQTKDKVVIVAEMIHDARIIPLDGSAHGSVRQWMGDSRGHWEGDTLVVETTNFNGKRALLGGRVTEGQVGPQGGGGRSGVGRPDSRMRIVERFTRTAPDILLYQFTVDDPGTYTKPWSGEIPMRAAQGPLYEYACHEGNYALADILSGARAEEKQAANNKKSK
jgi:hypothetical protein